MSWAACTTQGVLADALPFIATPRHLGGSWAATRRAASYDRALEVLTRAFGEDHEATHLVRQNMNLHGMEMKRDSERLDETDSSPKFTSTPR